MADITITGPDGSTFSFPSDTPSDTIGAVMRQQYGGPSQPPAGQNQEGNFLAPLAQGLTFGLSDELAGAGQAVGALFTDETMGDAYDRGKQRTMNRLEGFRERNPVTATALEVGGAILPAVASGGMGLAARGGGLLAKSGGAALEGAAGGALYGFNTGEGGAAGRAANAGMGAGFGAIGGAAAPLVGRAAGAVARPVVEAIKARAPQIGGAGRSAVKRVMQGMGDDALEAPADLAARRAEIGPDGRLYNAGENLRTQAETLAQRPGPQMRTIMGAAKEQTSGSGARVRSGLDAAIGKQENITKAFDDAIASRKTKANQLYGAAFKDARPVDVTRVIDRIDEEILPPELATDLRDDGISATLRKVREYFATDQNQRHGLQSLHKVKMELDGMIGTAKRAGDDPKARALLGVQKELLDAMDSANKTYATARREFAGDMAIQNAMEEGQSVFSRTMRATDLAKEYGRMTPAEQLAMKKGARDQIAQMMDNALPNLADNADAQAVWKRLQTKENQQKMSILLGPEAAKKVQLALSREWKLSADANTMLANSATARRTAAKDMFPDPNKAPEFPVAPSAYSRLESLAGGAASKMAGGALKSRNKALNADAARLLGLPLDSPYIDELMAARLRMAQGQALGNQVAGRIGMQGNRSVLGSGIGASAVYNER
ncbi:hypothetical protein [Aurantimonas coralicida]|uniref:hypothetical protein n=1 Tax=Aurantimonas coralicida TaxID=182270 RepID=UPI001E49D70B|nr:hypothetical protein [Aurantimonas coralicida]MCD1644168.1 hypothetical protein [Aurantimonas coralicida]